MINSIQEQTLFATIRIEVIDCTGKGIGIGTGFLLQRLLEENKSKIYLVSNKHVLHAGNGFILNFITKENGNPIFNKLTKIKQTEISERIIAGNRTMMML